MVSVVYLIFLFRFKKRNSKNHFTKIKNNVNVKNNRYKIQRYDITMNHMFALIIKKDLMLNKKEKKY